MPHPPPRHIIALVALALLDATGIPAPAAPPPADRWLPSNTVAYVTVANAAQARAQWLTQAPARFWGDPALRPFRAHFEAGARSNLFVPLAQSTGLDLTRLPALAQGQVTLALLNEAAPEAPNPAPAQLLLLDAGPQRDALRAWLAGVGSHTSAEPGPRLADTSFVTLSFTPARLEEILTGIQGPPAPPTPPKPPRTVPPWRLHLGERDGVLLASTSTQALAQVLARLAPKDGRAPAEPNADSPPPAPPHAVEIVSGWLDPRPWLGALARLPLGPLALLESQPGAVSAQLVHALGLDGLRAATFAVRAGPDGWFLDLELSVPITARRGLFKLLEVLPAEAGPPPFLGTETTAFRRARFSGPAVWQQIERTLTDLDPTLAGVVQLFAEAIGTGADTQFNFQRSVLSRLGDDWVVATAGSASNASPTELVFVPSPQAPALADAFTTIASPASLGSFLPPNAPATSLVQDTIAGHRVTSVSIPPLAEAAGSPVSLHFAARDHHVAFATERSWIARFVASGPSVPLASRADLQAATQSVGGTAGGYFSFADERRTAAAPFAGLRHSPQALAHRAHWLSLLPATRQAFTTVVGWMDFTKLPPFEAVESSFGLRVTAGRVTTNGFQLTTFRPDPAKAAR